ncbi:hypothetical protein OESDEN_01930 [Oesophagostomum dentatum]|uniref:Thiamin pyrophosphokinase thiamin-binding domain-containing protein n=1 Tax=Oesophagostomum dentatum TaxID=61180 RepID=A0A0B1TQJ6_OESDE|nr:hypothetical protein OESDEN_01930 [Oesophagostomum dentatum]
MEQDLPQASRVLLLGGTSGRFDHTLATINSLYYSSKFLTKDVYCLDGENLTCVLDEGEHVVRINPELVTGTCGIVPFCQKPTIVTMSGFRWNLGSFYQFYPETDFCFIAAGTQLRLYLEIEGEPG